MPTYDVRVIHWVPNVHHQEVEARNIEEACSLALDKASDADDWDIAWESASRPYVDTIHGDEDELAVPESYQLPLPTDFFEL